MEDKIVFKIWFTVWSIQSILPAKFSLCVHCIDSFNLWHARIWVVWWCPWCVCDYLMYFPFGQIVEYIQTIPIMFLILFILNFMSKRRNFWHWHTLICKGMVFKLFSDCYLCLCGQSCLVLNYNFSWNYLNSGSFELWTLAPKY